MQMIPYLNFEGNCAEAFRFYEQCFGGTLDLTTNDSPSVTEKMPPGWENLILNATLFFDGGMIMGSDSPPGQHAAMQGMQANVIMDDVPKAERIFAQLAEGGLVTMAMEKTFWAERFGMVVDRFGTPWMINCNMAA